MLQYFLAVCKNKFYVYRTNGAAEYFGGNAYFEYEQSKIREATVRLIEEILNNNNLSDRNELQFALIENSDAVRNEIVLKELKNLVVKRFRVNDLVFEAMNELAKNPALYIYALGVNYDGESYHLEKNNPMWRGVYSLLALTIEPRELLKFTR